MDKDNLLKYVLCLLTSSFPSYHYFLFLHFICYHSTPLLFFLQSLQLHSTYLHYYVNRYILEQLVFFLQLDCTRASFFFPGPRYILSKSCCSHLLSFFSPGPSDSQIYLFIYLKSLCFDLLTTLASIDDCYTQLTLSHGYICQRRM